MNGDRPKQTNSAASQRTASHRRRGWSYLLAVAVTVATLALRLGLASWFGDRPVLVLFILPIILSAYVGGLGPGLVATTVVGLGTSYFLMPPTHSFAMTRSVDTMQWLILIFVGVIISVLTESLHAARRSESDTEARGQSLVTERKVQVGFGLALLFLVVTGAISVFGVTRLREDTGWATHTEVVVASLRLLLSTVTDAETAERGYIITGEQNYLGPYDDARRALDGELDGLRKLTADNGNQQRQLDELGPLITERLAVAGGNIALRRRQDLNGTQASQLIAEGKSLHDRIRVIIARMEATEQSLLLEREDRAQRVSLITRTVIIFGGSLAFISVATALFMMKQGFGIRRRAEAALRELTDQLETRVRERTAELEQTNAALGESGELFSKAFLLSPDCVAIVRLADRTVLKANEALCRLWGSTPTDVIGKPTREYTTWLHEAEQRAFMRTLQEKGECLDYETTLRLHDGRMVELNVSSRLITLDGEACVLSVMRDITERKRTEVAAAQLAAIVEYSDDAIVGKDLAGTVTSWNAGAEKIFGYSAREMVGQPVARLIPLERQQEEKDIIDRVRRGESVRHFDTVRLRKDGSTVDVAVTVSAIRGPAGNIVGASKVARDITGRKKAEAAVLASEARYRTLFEYGPDGIVIADQDSYYLDANTSLCRMLGYTRDEFIGLHATDIVAPAETPHIGEAIDLLKAKSDYQREWQFRRKDGSLFPADVIATQMPDGNLLAVIRDITERKRAEEAIRVSGEHFRFLNDLGEATRTLADSNQIMAVMVRMLGEHLHASRCAYADVENDGEQFTILHDYTDGCASTVGQYQLSLFGKRAVATLHSGQTLIIRDVEKELKPDEGAAMFSAIGIGAIITCPLVKEGVLRAMMAVHQTAPRDWQQGEITIVQEVVERCWSSIERRTAEEKIHRLNLELEQRVIERTGQLEAANKELEAFSYSVSHDLRAPLRAVDGFSQAVLEDFGPQLPEEGRRYLQTIRGGAQRMGELIDDLLTFARLSRLPLEKRMIDTDQLVRGTLDELGSPWADRRVEVRIGALPASLGDQALLRQVWINLISNALKYTRKREQVVIEIGCSLEKGRNTYFIRDNGTGFDMQYAHKLFGVFQRLHRAEDYEGTGVGLAIVQRIVHRHGGRVWAEAAVDRGATFYFTLEGETNS